MRKVSAALIGIALAVTSVMGFVPSSSAETPDQIMAFSAMTQAWTLADWWNWGVLESAIEAQQARDQKAFYEGVEAGPTKAQWERIARCETGGNWQMTGSRFSGGVGFYNGTWDAYGGREFATLAGYATEDQQIVVANRIPNFNPFTHDLGHCSGW